MKIFFIFLINFGCFLANKKAKKCRNGKTIFVVAFSFVGKHIHIKFQKILSNGLDFANFLNFFSILAVFWPQKGQKRQKSKKKIVAFSFVGKHLHTKFQKMSSKGLDFANFLHFWSILSVFWFKNGQKRPKSKKSFFVAFFFVGKHLHTKFQKI